MEKFPFLSPEWESAATALTDVRSVDVPSDVSFSLNATVTDSPYGEKHISITLSDGIASFHDAHTDDSDVQVRTNYDTARTLFLGGDFTVVLSAMLEGTVVVGGDIAKLLSLANSSGPMPSMPFIEKLSEQLISITE